MTTPPLEGCPNCAGGDDASLCALCETARDANDVERALDSPNAELLAKADLALADLTHRSGVLNTAEARGFMKMLIGDRLKTVIDDSAPIVPEDTHGTTRSKTTPGRDNE